MLETGLDVCLRDPPELLQRGRFALLMNQASIDRHFRYTGDLLADRFPGQLHAILSPQHGLWGEQQANMIESPDTRSPRLGVPVHSLYSHTRRPTPEMLHGIDLLVVDLQDVGTRVYTFAWTIRECLLACREHRIPMLLLDRPNPLGGTHIEGNSLEAGFESFVGGAPIPMRHALTLGELARQISLHFDAADLLTVVPMIGWQRTMPFEVTGLPWVPPSPNLPTLASVRVYPGQVLLEGTNLSEGRGTTLPFEVVGAPFVDAERLADALATAELPGVRFRPIRFVPTFDKWAGRSCAGVALHVTDPETFRPYRTTLEILARVKRSWPGDFEWLPPPYEYETVKPPIDIISGGDRLRLTLEAGTPSAEELDALAQAPPPSTGELLY